MTEETLNSFSLSVERLAEILGEPRTVANRDSAIKRFELTFELAWKSIKVRLGNKGVICRSPRDSLMEAFRMDLLTDDPRWLKMIEDRNLSVHTYNEELAEGIYGRLKDYLRLFANLKESLAR
ncbi:MAG: nucleotidyltransferase substrate binding protein [Candidatus Liptonbacteria bacterium]|nr:nucleotidyltransferase substrate binding protein [Candidatus Liptonbacteria bacterium]